MNLNQLPVSHGFRLRGTDMTRIETFTDAAFAFALTMLVISFDELPQSFDDFEMALRQIPVFGACFAQITLFWYAHHTWSRRYGLDDLATSLWSLLLVFVTLIYVYPLRVIFSAFFHWTTDGWIQFMFQQVTVAELRTIFVIYGVGFAAMSLILVGHYRHAERRAETLQLSAYERFQTRASRHGWTMVALTGVAATAAAAWLPMPYGLYSGFIYATLGVTGPLLGRYQHRKAQALDLMPHPPSQQ
ncbi:MAG: TMEM175 family protein [Xanthomonadales bacterium]|nr:TMEM175 family protein [Xanthomonadales bacterium]